jgi:hypothetical protein
VVGISAVLAVERMRWKSGGSFTPRDLKMLGRIGDASLPGGKSCFDAAFDLLALGGVDMRERPLRERWAQLCALSACFGGTDGAIGTSRPTIILAEMGNGGEVLEAVLADGGEGVVAKAWDAPWGAPMWACKRLQTFYCVVTGFNGGTQSVKIGILHDYAPSGKIGPDIHVSDCGSVPLLGGKCDRVRVGSIIKVEGFGLTAGGKIREPRVCRDTATSWLVKY